MKFTVHRGKGKGKGKAMMEGHHCHPVKKLLLLS
jgi:hypothetical protein